MQITINISEEGKVTAQLQGTQPIGEAVVYSSPGPGEAAFSISESLKGRVYEGGSAPVTLQEGMIPLKTKPISDLGSRNGGSAPQS